MSGQDRFRRLLPFDQENRQRERETIVGQMLRCRNQVATSVAVKLNSTRTIVNSVDSTAPVSSREMSRMGTVRIDSKGGVQRSTVVEESNTKNKVEWQYCTVFGGK